MEDKLILFCFGCHFMKISQKLFRRINRVLKKSKESSNNDCFFHSLPFPTHLRCSGSVRGRSGCSVVPSTQRGVVQAEHRLPTLTIAKAAWLEQHLMGVFQNVWSQSRMHVYYTQWSMRREDCDLAAVLEYYYFILSFLLQLSASYHNHINSYEILIKCEPLVYTRAWRAVQKEKKREERRGKRPGWHTSNNKLIHGQHTSRHNPHLIHTHTHTQHRKSNDVINRKRWREYRFSYRTAGFLSSYKGGNRICWSSLVWGLYSMPTTIVLHARKKTHCEWKSESSGSVHHYCTEISVPKMNDAAQIFIRFSQTFQGM